MQNNNANAFKLVPEEGWHVMHLYYNVNHELWASLSQEEKDTRIIQIKKTVEDIKSHPETQLFSQAVATPKADLGFMLITPDLVDAVTFEKKLTLALGGGVLIPSYSYLSQTERSEYTTSREQYAEDTLKGEQNLSEGSAEFDEALKAFDDRMEHYLKHRMYPIMPDWEVICFYPMSKRRDAGFEAKNEGSYNWYSLEFEARRKLMGGHARTGRQYSGKILQLITGSTGLDTHEWGVSLFAHDTFQIKAIVYEMRFDEVSARFGEFGDFYIGINLPIEAVLEKTALS